MRSRLTLPLILGLVLAGCLTPPADPGAASTLEDAPRFAPVVPDAPDFDFTNVVDPEHASHQMPHLHGAGHGLALVGHTGIASVLPAGVTGSITQVDVHEGYAVVAGYQGDLAFVLLDIMDPTSPQPLSAFLGAGNPRTARFSDDGAYVFYGCESPSTPPLVGTCRDPGEVETTPATGGIVVVDVQDTTAPRFVDFLPTGGAHNIFTTAVDGVDYVFTSASNILRFDRETGTLAEVATVPGEHDVTVARHPATGDLLLFTGTHQLAIYNVNDPTEPELVYQAEGEVDWVGWHDQVLVPGLVDGRAILLLGGETFVGTDAGGAIHILDVTDPTRPEKVGEWNPPWSPMAPWVSYLFSMHEMAATPTGQVAIGWNHAGVWVIDVSTRERQAAPVTLAAYQPHEMPDAPPSAGPSSPLWMLPRVWNAGWDERGYLVVPDMLSGVYVLEPDWGLHPALDSGQ